MNHNRICLKCGKAFTKKKMTSFAVWQNKMFCSEECKKAHIWNQLPQMDYLRNDAFKIRR